MYILAHFQVVKEHGLLCAWDLEQFGYEELKVSSKLELFKVCDVSDSERNTGRGDHVSLKNYLKLETLMQEWTDLSADVSSTSSLSEQIALTKS